MSSVKNYRAFAGRHWETGSVCNFLAAIGARAPHTKKPYSEALLLGVSGGIVMGYFSFAYKGHDPHAAILTRNTFDPLNTMLSRLGIVQELRQTANPEKGLANLLDTLQDGRPAIVWADAWSLPYNALAFDKALWASFPIIVYAHDDDAAHIADRAAVPLTVTPQELAAARARVKQDKFRLLILDLPDPEKLPPAVQLAIWDTLKRYTEAPVKNAKNNFGFAAFERWANVLARTNDKQSWTKIFPTGGAMYAGLVSAFDRFGMGASRHGERDLYADFLDEASVILNLPALTDAAKKYRACAKAWDELSNALLPDAIAPFKQTRELILQRRALFVEQGNASIAARQKINARLEKIRADMDKHFPLDDAGVVQLRENIAAHVLHLRDVEREAYEVLLGAMETRGEANGR